MRLARFSLVGVLGIGVQIFVLAGLTAIGTEYLIATCLAVESATVHNFLWHRGFTWRDRSPAGGQKFQAVVALQDYGSQDKYYAPEVERSRLLQHDGNNFKVFLRLRKKKIGSVVLDTNYDVTYQRMTEQRATARSVSTRIVEVENTGRKNESEKPVGNDGGFMWRLSCYWQFEQRHGGTYVQLEAISLSRDIPNGFGWLVDPFVTSIPKESLEFTLSRILQALGKVKLWSKADNCGLAYGNDLRGK